MSELFCPVCRLPLRRIEAPGATAKCTECSRLYPIVRNCVPVLLENADEYLRGFSRSCEEYGELATAQIQACDRAIVERPERKDILEKYQHALRTHAGIMASLRADLQPHLGSAPPSDTDSPGIAYSSNLNYARRDWCGDAAAESELSDIQGAIRNLLEDRTPVPQRSLVLGAGAGRTAWDLCDLLPDITALDLSYTMAGIFDRILEGPVGLYAVNRSNTLRTQDLVQHGIARLPDPGAKDDRLKRFRFWVADARRLPLPDQSIDAVFSIYFTDVLPLEHLLGEVKRVLKSGGVFVHYGPLDYHFEDFAASLAAEEVRDRLARNRFQIVGETMVESTHLVTAGQMVRYIFENWAFVAENRNGPPPVPLNESDILALPDGLRHIHAGPGSSQLGTLLLPDGSKLECGPGVRSLIDLVDGRRTVREIIALMQHKHGMWHDSASAQLLATLQNLLEYRLIERR